MDIARPMVLDIQPQNSLPKLSLGRKQVEPRFPRFNPAAGQCPVAVPPYLIAKPERHTFTVHLPKNQTFLKDLQDLIPKLQIHQIKASSLCHRRPAPPLQEQDSHGT